jgi:hypothetical protein
MTDQQEKPIRRQSFEGYGHVSAYAGGSNNNLRVQQTYRDGNFQGTPVKTEKEAKAKEEKEHLVEEKKATAEKHVVEKKNATSTTTTKTTTTTIDGEETYIIKQDCSAKLVGSIPLSCTVKLLRDGKEILVRTLEGAGHVSTFEWNLAVMQTKKKGWKAELKDDTGSVKGAFYVDKDMVSDSKLPR